MPRGAYIRETGTGRPEGGESGLDPHSETSMTPVIQPFAAKPLVPPQAAKPGMLQEIFNLDEGPVTLTVPATLSEESYEDLQA